MISYPSPLLAVGGARTGIAPVNLLDVQDVNGNYYCWSDRKIVAPYAAGAQNTAPSGLTEPVTPATGQHVAWIRPTKVTAVSGTHVVASANLSSGSLTISYSWPFSTEGTITWSGFSVPSLPPGAILDAAYLVALVESTVTSPAYFLTSPSGSNGQCSSSTDPTKISTAVITAWLNATVPSGDITGVGTVTSPAIALYYHFAGKSTLYSSDAAPYGWGEYSPWLLSVPQLTFHRSSVTDVGNFILQNLSGDTVSRDFEKIMRKSALEGAFFVYRCWQADAQASWIEVHGTLTVEDVGVDTVTLKGTPVINPAQDDTPDKEYSETCQWRWGSPQCGATGTTECQYSYQTCQVPERILVVLNNYEKNYGENAANVPTQTINRRRRF